MKKAILVVSFGTTHKETREATIEKVEQRIKKEFPEYELRKAYTSHMILRVLRERDGILVDTPEEAFGKLKVEGFEDVIVQPLHVMPGEEYDYIKNVVESFEKDFTTLLLGRPLLFFKGQEEIPDDYSVLVTALQSQLSLDQAIVLMGHGTSHPANAVYACFEQVLKDHGFYNVYMGTVEGYPTISNVVERLKRDGVKEATLMPFMLVAGDHAKNDMAGDDEDSWKNLLKAEGIKANIFLHGLGENEKIQQIYVEHIRDVMKSRYLEIGKTKKGRVIVLE